MLNFKKKVAIFTKILSKKETSYADSFNANIEIVGLNHDYSFLKKLNSKQDIILWIAKLKGRIVLKEDESTIEDIIDDYILCG